MAHIFRKPGKKTWWASYNLDDKRVRHSLRTKQERIERKYDDIVAIALAILSPRVFSGIRQSISRADAG